MRCIPNYRVCYQGVFYEAGHAFPIETADADEMRQHGRVVDDPTPPTEPPIRRGRQRRADNGQPGEAEATNRRG